LNNVKKWLKTVSQLVAVGALFAAGVVYTVQAGQLPPQLHVTGFTPPPAAVIRAPSVSVIALRVAAVLKHYTNDSGTANRIAGAIVDEGARRKLDPALLVGVLLTENEALDTMARSTVGARGLMQVMPEHRGKWGCPSSNLFGIEANICYGASILQDVMRTAPSTRVALLRYNGCVTGSNTPGCHSYPDRVLRLANRTTAQILAFAE
jgi:soluble lytic murein transglycosylase-like protein